MSRSSRLSRDLTLMLRRYEDVDIRSRLAVLISHIIIKAIWLDITKHELLAVVDAAYEEAIDSEYRKVGDA